MFGAVLYFCLFLLSCSILITLYRIIVGESLPDRALALDTIGYNILGIVAVLSIILDTQVFLEVILLFGVLAFVGTVSLCKFIERGVVIDVERDR